MIERKENLLLEKITEESSEILTAQEGVLKEKSMI